MVTDNKDAACFPQTAAVSATVLGRHKPRAPVTKVRRSDVSLIHADVILLFNPYDVYTYSLMILQLYLIIEIFFCMDYLWYI